MSAKALRLAMALKINRLMRCEISLKKNYERK